ncbi:hypothetical protein HY633_01475 [Candidatus Uhrbacteria bacterium]|nr:hypothetical protein [Candidatus Uhrbacteria bacterium]
MPTDTKAKLKHHHWVLFKTAAGRVTFLVLMTALLMISAVVIGLLEFLKVYGDKIGPTAPAWRAAAIAVFLAGAAILTAELIGSFLITRKIRKLAQVVRAIIEKKGDPGALPYGLGELDDITATFEKLASEWRDTQATMEQQVKMRTSVLELSKGMTELDKVRTEALIDSIAEGVVATDNEGKITFLNDVAKAGLWWNPDAAMGVAIHSAYRLEDEKENVIDEKLWPTKKALKEVKKVVTPAPSKPYYLRCRDKSRFPVKMTLSPLVIDDEIAGMLATFEDISAEVDLDRRKTEFISIASHQLRSPATAIKFMTDMMRTGEFGAITDKQKEWVGKLYTASDTMLDLVNELLNISRLEAGAETERTPQDIVALAEKTLKETEPLLLAKRQKFAFVKNGAASPACDPLMIGEVMKNFLSNASKYSPDDGTVTVTIDVSDAAAKFSVADQGMGIPKSEHNRMFGKFFRAENAVKSPIIGTGLGLYYCKTVIEKHGGRIGFDSEVGKGSTFWFELPLAAKK